MRVYFSDVRSANLCARGFRTWARHQGWSNAKIREFLQHGLPIEEIEALNDGLANRAVTAARERIAREVSRGQ